MAGLFKPFEVSEEDIEKLEAAQLVQLIKRLVIADLHAAGIPLSAADASLKIYVPDGGEDIRVEWTSPQLKTNFIPSSFTVFQLKAEKLADAKVKQEPVERDGTLKAALAETVVRKGAYVLVTSKLGKTPTKGPKGAKKKKKPRVDEIRALLRGAIVGSEPKAGKIAIDVYGPTKIVQWTNSHPMVAIWLKQLLRFSSADFAFQTLDDWSKYEELANPLVAWDSLNANMLAIQERLLHPRKVIRLQGHSGLGKSRMVYEALARTATDPGRDLTPMVAYAREVPQGILTQVRDFIKNNNRVVLVVDDCPPDLHRQLSDEVHRHDSKLSLITLDLNFDSTEDNQIIVEEAPTDKIRDILISSGFTGSADDIERAAQFCTGFPRVAVWVGRASAEGSQHFANFRAKEHVVQRLVWGRGPPDTDLLRILRCLAIFDVIGFDEPRDDEFRWIAKHLLDMTADKLEQKLEHFRERRILQKRGYSLLVVPKPLAAYLAAVYWETVTREKRALLLRGTMPADLQRALCDRLADLNYLEDARRVAAQLCGESGPFGTAEALNTELGARCLRKLAEVAPEETAAALVSAFGTWTVNQVKERLGPGRRDLVWAIDTLAWEPSVFHDVMRILLKFAGGENEKWANNATGEFVQRFRVQLPGTSASLTQRLECLEQLVADAAEEELTVLLDALRDAIDARGHSRTVGSERHGTRRTYEDYNPKTYSEIFDYARGVLRLLLQVAKANPLRLPAIRGAIASIDPGVVIAEPVFAQYGEAIQYLRPPGEIWGELIEKLAWSLRYQLSGKSKGLKAVREKVRALVDDLLPKSLEDRIIFYVKNVPWNFDEPGAREDKTFESNRKRARKLAKEAAKHWGVFTKVLPSLSQGEVREGFAFGQTFYHESARPEEAIALGLRELKVLSDKIPNPSLLGGLLSGLFEDDPTAVSRILQEVAATPELRKFLVYLASINLTTEALAIIVDQLATGGIPPEQANLLGMGGVLKPLPSSDVKKLINTLRERDTEGVTTALDLLGMYTLSSEPKFLDMREEINAVLRSRVIFNERSRTMLNHHYETLAGKLLKDRKFGKSLARFIAAALIEAARNNRLANDMLFRKLATLIFRQYPGMVLPIFAEEVEKSGSRDRWFLSNVLGSPFSFGGKGEGALFNIDESLIVSVSKQFGKFALLVAEVAPLFSNGTKGREWSSLGRALLGEFGNQKGFLDAISRNIFTGGWTGPTSVHLQSFVVPLETLKNHKKQSVRVWARRALTSLKEQIAREIKNEEEESVRSA